MANIAHPLWLLIPLLALAVFFVTRDHRQLPGSWNRAIRGDLQAFLGYTIQQVNAPSRILALFTLWLVIAAALATISLGQIETPKLRNLDARIVVIDLGVPEIAEDRIAAARYLIDKAENVPTAVIAVTEHAFDVVPLTRDRTHLDRYLQALTADVMPIDGRSILAGIERAIALLDRADIQAHQITVFTGAMPSAHARFNKPGRDEDPNIWLVLPEKAKAAWRGFAGELNAKLVSDRETKALHRDFEERRQDAAAKVVSTRERQDMTPWLIALLLPLWLFLFFRRQPV